MAPPSVWSDEEYIALHKWFNADDVQQKLILMPDPTRGRSRAKSAASSENLRSIADLFIARWKAQYNFPWKAETGTQFAERTAKLRRDHSDVVCKGWTFRHMQEDETLEKFNERVRQLPTVSTSLSSTPLASWPLLIITTDDVCVRSEKLGEGAED